MACSVVRGIVIDADQLEEVEQFLSLGQARRAVEPDGGAGVPVDLRLAAEVGVPVLVEPGDVA